jgi:hypothetical protein
VEQHQPNKLHAHGSNPDVLAVEQVFETAKLTMHKHTNIPAQDPKQYFLKREAGVRLSANTGICGI